MRKKEDNKGFTLVELIIAVAILTVVVTPLVANFIQSSNLNLKGRKSMNASNLAQDIMEGMSAYSATELDRIMEKAVSDNTVDLKTSFMPQSTSYDAATLSREVVANTTKKGLNDKFIYKIKNVQTVAGSNHNKYDVEIVIDASDARHNAFNGDEVAEITEIDQYYDAVYTIPDNDISTAVSALITASTQKQKNYNDYLGKLVRDININIKNEGTDAVPVYTIRVENKYHVTNAAQTELGLNSSTVASGTESGNISNTKLDMLPRSVYLYFEGMEGARYDNSPEMLENINILNTTGQKITVYLIRTQDKTKKTNSSVASYNETFGCRVNIKSLETDGITPNKNVELVSNLRYNLNYSSENNYRKYKEGSSESLYTQEELNKKPSVNYYNASRAVYNYNGSVIDENDYKEYISDGYRKKEKNILYDVTLNLYEPGTTDKVATYTGGLSD